MKFVIALLIALLSTACLKIEDKPKDTPQESNPEPVMEIIPETRAGVEITALPELHRYQVSFPVESDVQIIHRYPVEKPNEMILLPLNVADGRMSDSEILDGTTYIYQLSALRDGQIEVINEMEVVVPKDLEINAPVILTENAEWKGYGRIYFGPNARITTQQFDLTVEADQLISENALLETFPSGAAAAVDQPGRSGGTVQFKVNSAKGKLNVEMRGEAGGVGSPPPIQPESANYIVAWEAQTGGRRINPLQGADGLNGNPGAKGGDSGHFMFQIQNQSDIICDPLLKPGPGGAGGPGGNGENHPSLDLIPGKPGQQGPAGAAGQVGGACVRDGSSQCRR